MQTEGNDVMPAENLGVARVRRQAFNNSSFVGGMVTSRIGNDGSSNTAYGLDSVLRFASGDELVVRWAQTFDTAPDSRRWGASTAAAFTPICSAATAVAGATPQWPGGAVRTTCRSWDFRPARVSGSSMARSGTGGCRRAGRCAPPRPGSTAEVTGASRTAVLDSGHFGFGGNMQTDGDLDVDGPARFSEDLLEGFELDDGVEVPQGEYQWVGLQGGFSLPQGRNIELWGNGYVGQFYDGQRLRARVGPEWTVSRHFTAGLMYEFNAIRFPERQQDLLIHVAQLRLQWSLNSKISADLLSQLSSLDQMVASNLRFRYNFREGTDLYVVFSESILTHTWQDGLICPDRMREASIVKYSYSWSL